MRRAHRGIRIAASAGSIAILLVGATSLASAQPTFEVVAKDLDNPRHLTFSATGDLYVAEAGKGVHERVRVRTVPLTPSSGSSASGLPEP